MRSTQHLGGDLAALLDQDVTALGLDVVLDHLAQKEVLDLGVPHLEDDAFLVLGVGADPVDLLVLDGELTRVLLDALAGEDLNPDDHALDTGRAAQGGVADISRLLAEDRAQELLFRRQLGLALGRDLADEDRALPDLGADVDDPGLVELGQRRLGDVGDVAGDLLGAELGVSGRGLELLDVDRGVVVLLDQLLGDDDRVLEVVAPPRHERDQHVVAEGELAGLGVGPVGQNLALDHGLTLRHQRFLVDGGVLVRAPELGHLVDVGAELALALRPRPGR